MDYNRIYTQIIETRRRLAYGGYTENHHILPKSLGGSDEIENLVALSAREHFLCHYLLTKMYQPKTKEFYDMIKAFGMMCWCSSSNQERYVNSRMYKRLKDDFSRAMSEAQQGKNNSQHGTMWVYNEKLRQCKKVGKGINLELGWLKGRIFNFDRHAEDKETELYIKAVKSYACDIRNKIVIYNYSKLYELYCQIGFNDMALQTGYKFSQQNFVMRCERYVPNFIPQMGKSRI